MDWTIGPLDYFLDYFLDHFLNQKYLLEHFCIEFKHLGRLGEDGNGITEMAEIKH